MGYPTFSSSQLWRTNFLLLLVGCVAISLAQAAPALKVLSRAPLPEGPSTAMDIRWASDDSVYLLRARHGTTEMGLDGARRGIVMPEGRKLNRYDEQTGLVASKAHLGVLDWSQVSWRSFQKAASGEVLFEKRHIPIVMDADIQGDRLLVLGILGSDRRASDGALAWIGPLQGKDKDLKPVLHDQGGSGAPHFFNCPANELGKVRFLSDGSFLIVPGFQKGVHLFNAAGKELRSWTSEELGLNTDCSQHDEKLEAAFRADAKNWVKWVNQHRVVDDILVLPEGPGLLVRSYETGKARWELKVLTPTNVKTYALPLQGDRPADRLQGDVRGDRIVLLRSPSGNLPSKDPADHRGELVVLEVPR